MLYTCTSSAAAHSYHRFDVERETTTMTPVWLLFLFIAVTAAIPSRMAKVETEIDENSDVSDIIERANKGLKNVVYGDIVQNKGRNASPCTSVGCTWPKQGSKVYIPVSIARHYNFKQRGIIIRALITFHKYTCIRFVWRNKDHRNYIFFYSGSGCWSYIGRQSQGQPISLRRRGCLYTSTVQHEVLHALGFHHEQNRSDRDDHVEILTENISEENEHNFDKVDTHNLETPYDFESVMQYSKFAFSKNGEPTIIAKSDPDLEFGHATFMSQTDVDRINKLYNCYD